MPYSAHIIKLLDKVSPPIREVFVEILAEIERQRQQWEESVTKVEFNELKNIVAELADAQRRTEGRVNSLAQRMEELAEAQRKTEERVDSLTERVRELAEAQRRTEEELRKLISEHRKTREELGGLSHTVGYVLEDKAYLGLPHLLKRDFGVDVKELRRDFVEVAPDRYEEVNIMGKGSRNGASVWILGECKAQLKRRDVDAFLRKLSRIEHFFPGERILLVVTYQASPQVRRYVEEKGLKLYFSYQLGNAKT